MILQRGVWDSDINQHDTDTPQAVATLNDNEEVRGHSLRSHKYTYKAINNNDEMPSVYFF